MPDSVYLTVGLTDAVERVSPNVWLLTGFPNIAFVVGDTATLVVDTGLGVENGALVARVAATLSRGAKLFLTTTHFHPEHTGGIGGFPTETVLIRARAQQDEMDELGESILAAFRQSPRYGEATPLDSSLRPPDVVFDAECSLDLGGVRVRLMYLGAGHTRGDELIYVEEDRALIGRHRAEADRSDSRIARRHLRELARGAGEAPSAGPEPGHTHAQRHRGRIAHRR